MPVRNAMPYLDSAVASILGQSHAEFEFVILDDGSTDGSDARAAEWAARDPRIVVARSQHSAGLVTSGNHAVALASGDLVARMDADDIADPRRLERQLAVFAEYDDAVLVGCNWDGIDARGRTVRAQVAAMLTSKRLSAPFCHGSIMFRRSAFERIGGYRPQCEYWEDTDFYYRMAQQGRVLVLPDLLYHYRFSASSARFNADCDAVERAVDLYFRCSDVAGEKGGYEQILAAGVKPAPARVSPRVFAALSAHLVWAGLRPRNLWRALQRSAPPRKLLDWASIVYLCLGNLQPHLLRSLLNLSLRWRDRPAAGRFADGRAVEWYWSKRRHHATCNQPPTTASIRETPRIK
jgi:glycosyltransferase involved in cell wall biosynthesis